MRSQVKEIPEIKLPVKLVTVYENICAFCDRFLMVKRGQGETGECVQTLQVPTSSASRDQPQHVKERPLFGDAYRPRQELVLPASGCLF